MRTSLSHRCARFLDARDMLRRAFPFAHAQMIPICAGMAAGQDRPWDAGRLYACRDLIQEETGLFSNFRGAGHLAVITLLALSPAPEERMAFALQGYKVLRTRFYASQYLPLAALLLAGAARFRWKQLFTPCIVASVLGLVLALTRLRPPALVGEMLDFVGDITVPLSLLVVGSLLAGMSAGQVLRSPKLWLLTVLLLAGLVRHY